jgi:hypothetical protein
MRHTELRSSLRRIQAVRLSVEQVPKPVRQIDLPLSVAANARAPAPAGCTIEREGAKSSIGGKWCIDLMTENKCGILNHDCGFRSGKRLDKYGSLVRSAALT